MPIGLLQSSAPKKEDKSMQTTIIRFGLIGLAVATVLVANQALAETVNYKATLSAKDEVPPNASTGTGSAEIIYDTTTKMLTWTVTFDGLTGPATVAHFHGPAAPGANAGVVVLIANNPTSPAQGTATLTDAQAADLQGGRWYVNVHTAANRGGELRGQVVK
jgi:CHRD domain